MAKENFLDKLFEKTVTVPKIIFYGFALYPLAAALIIATTYKDLNSGIQKQGIELTNKIYTVQGGNEMLNPAYYKNFK